MLASRCEMDTCLVIAARQDRLRACEYNEFALLKCLPVKPDVLPSNAVPQFKLEREILPRTRCYCCAASLCCYAALCLTTLASKQGGEIDVLVILSCPKYSDTGAG